MKNFSGFYPALITPYTKDNKVNYDSLKKLIEKLIYEGVTGFYITGSTGECFLLSHEERSEIIRFVLSETSGRVNTIVHVGSTSTDESISLAKTAEKYGADAVSAVPPFYYKYSFSELKAHYEMIINNCTLPMLIYNFPVMSGVTFTAENIAELCRLPRVIGLKHTSMNLYELEQFKRASENIIVLNGHDEILLGALAMGADGAVGSTFNIMFPLIKQIYDSFTKGDILSAREYQKKANCIIDVLIRAGVNQGIKYILESRQEIECNDCRMPMGKISENSKAELDAIFDEIKF